MRKEGLAGGFTEKEVRLRGQLKVSLCQDGVMKIIKACQTCPLLSQIDWTLAPPRGESLDMSHPREDMTSCE